MFSSDGKSTRIVGDVSGFAPYGE
ncbi:hypothetical protein A2U01_0095433, partial [Trifolium medium]|nr:hypothetical protein [Trifolium medium]